MNNYYFTYSNDGSQPFSGGWTVVRAPDYNTAIELFNTVHKPRATNVVNCAWIHTEKTFALTGISHKGNFGKRCQEIIGVFTPDEFEAVGQMMGLKTIELKGANK